tara:strand:+ start:657 stop:968 length:312 start_codon:yes stop_codon:yes gene_type:complete
VYILIIFIIIKLFNPVYLKISSSFESISLIKNTCVPIKKINGSISNTIEGVFKKDKKIMYKKSILIFLKYSICSKILVIKIIIKKIENILKNEILKSLIKNLM